MLTDPVPHNLAQPHAATICAAIGSGKGCGGSSFLRTQHAELLSLWLTIELVSDRPSPEGSSVLDQMDEAFWSGLLEWASSNPSMSIVHGHLFQIVHTALRAGHEGCFRGMVESGALPRWLSECAQSESAEAAQLRGVAVLLANTLRLAAETSEASWLQDALSEQADWALLLPFLQTSTDTQIAQSVLAMNFVPPPPSLAPTSLWTQATEKARRFGAAADGGRLSSSPRSTPRKGAAGTASSGLNADVRAALGFGSPRQAAMKARGVSPAAGGSKFTPRKSSLSSAPRKDSSTPRRSPKVNARTPLPPGFSPARSPLGLGGVSKSPAQRANRQRLQLVRPSSTNLKHSSAATVEASSKENAVNR